MAIRIESRFVVPAALDRAWAILTDVPKIAPCIPGAEVTEVIDACTYKGRTRLKIGPVELMFNGEARLHDVDAAAYTSRLTARGVDSKGRGSVGSEMAFTLTAQGDTTRVDVTTEITLAGSVAQYGRGVGIIREVCNQLTQQFARNLAAQIEGRTDASAGGAVSAVGLVSGAVKSMVQRKSGTDPEK